MGVDVDAAVNACWRACGPLLRAQSAHRLQGFKVEHRVGETLEESEQGYVEVVRARRLSEGIGTALVEADRAREQGELEAGARIFVVVTPMSLTPTRLELTARPVFWHCIG